MTRISKIQVKQVRETEMLVVRRTIDFFTEYGDFMEEALDKMAVVLEENQLLSASGPIVCFHNIDLAALDVSIGLEVALPIQLAESEVRCVTIPSRLIAVTIDRGPYEVQDPTMEALLAWINEHGYTADGGIYYRYLNDEEQPPEEYLTEMYVPVAKNRM
ncbi:GyrI-like domain-containing protein [uncultured Enterococcus sp.]|uniref:GyrI-like domain-containing protein n=1 Tax=uncultured Enterococcus sp. TaxID=167972 RepID=UPI002AA93579|nr:GyrI-like domain-containing protein [uncultured Enterococcus sp.]